MKLLELNIEEFGGLRGRKILPGEGLNLIAGENESGKSTCYLFIKFMLYGFPRKTAGNTDRERSVSFDGHRAAGSLRQRDGVAVRRVDPAGETGHAVDRHAALAAAALSAAGGGNGIARAPQDGQQRLTFRQGNGAAPAVLFNLNA